MADAKLLHALLKVQESFITLPDHGRPDFNSLLRTILDLTESDYAFIGELFEIEENVRYNGEELGDHSSCSPNYLLRTYSILDRGWSKKECELYGKIMEGNGYLDCFLENTPLFKKLLICRRAVISSVPVEDPFHGQLLAQLPRKEGEEEEECFTTQLRNCLVFPIFNEALCSSTVDNYLTIGPGEEDVIDKALEENAAPQSSCLASVDSQVGLGNREREDGEGAEKEEGEHTEKAAKKQLIGVLCVANHGEGYERKDLETASFVMNTITLILNSYRDRRVRHQLERQIREELDQRVKERTQQLEATVVELSRARRTAEDAAKARAQFVANVSHEIRTPLNGIVGMLELLRSMGMTAEQQEYMDVMWVSCEMLTSLVSDLLDMNALMEEKLDLTKVSEFLPAAMAQAACRINVIRAHTKGLTLAVDTHNRLFEDMLGDRGRISQVLVNLLSNAIKYTKSGSILLHCSFVPVKHAVTHIAALDTLLQSEDRPSMKENETELAKELARYDEALHGAPSAQVEDRFMSQTLGQNGVSVHPCNYADDQQRTAFVHFSVWDTGMGISQKDVALLFRKFSQVIGSMTTPAEGVGLGLAISKELVEGMGGHFHAVSTRAGVGSIFSFCIPWKGVNVNLYSSCDEEGTPITTPNKKPFKTLPVCQDTNALAQQTVRNRSMSPSDLSADEALGVLQSLVNPNFITGATVRSQRSRRSPPKSASIRHSTGDAAGRANVFGLSKRVQLPEGSSIPMKTKSNAATPTQPRSTSISASMSSATPSSKEKSMRSCPTTIAPSPTSFSVPQPRRKDPRDHGRMGEAKVDEERDSIEDQASRLRLASAHNSFSGSRNNSQTEFLSQLASTTSPNQAAGTSRAVSRTPSMLVNVHSAGDVCGVNSSGEKDDGGFGKLSVSRYTSGIVFTYNANSTFSSTASSALPSQSTSQEQSPHGSVPTHQTSCIDAIVSPPLQNSGRYNGSSSVDDLRMFNVQSEGRATSMKQEEDASLLYKEEDSFHSLPSANEGRRGGDNVANPAEKASSSSNASSGSSGSSESPQDCEEDITCPVRVLLAVTDGVDRLCLRRALMSMGVRENLILNVPLQDVDFFKFVKRHQDLVIRGKQRSETIPSSSSFSSSGRQEGVESQSSNHDEENGKKVCVNSLSDMEHGNYKLLAVVDESFAHKEALVLEFLGGRYDLLSILFSPLRRKTENDLRELQEKGCAFLLKPAMQFDLQSCLERAFDAAESSNIAKSLPSSKTTQSLSRTFSHRSGESTPPSPIISLDDSMEGCRLSFSPLGINKYNGSNARMIISPFSPGNSDNDVCQSSEASTIHIDRPHSSRRYSIGVVEEPQDSDEDEKLKMSSSSQPLSSDSTPSRKIEESSAGENATISVQVKREGRNDVGRSSQKTSGKGGSREEKNKAKAKAKGKGKLQSKFSKESVPVDEEEKSKRGKKGKKKSSAVKSRSLRVLLVDDNSVNVMVLDRILRRCGVADVLTALSGKEGLYHLGITLDPSTGCWANNPACETPQQVDLILLDLQMPDMTGFEVAHILCTVLKTSRPIVIAVTANMLAQSSVEAMESEIDGYLFKPVHLKDIETLLEKLFPKSREYSP